MSVLFKNLRYIALLTALLLSLGSVAQESAKVYGAFVTDSGVEISWKVTDSDSRPSNVVIRYNRSAVLANEGEIWLYSDTVDFKEGSIRLLDLYSSSGYIYQVGFLNSNDQSEWTDREKFETKMPWGITRFLLMIGALCLFIYGMKTMSEGIQASAGSRLRNILRWMTKNRFAGVLSGFTLTGLLQSSSATTVMTVSFVNAGLITLTESAGIMMGANIGTTITGWLVSYFGFRFNITVYALLMFAAAAPLLLIKKQEVRSWSTALIGFALLFLGLGFLKEAVPTFDENSAFVAFFVEYSNQPILGTLMFIALGIIVTVIIQSSSSAITLTMALCASGVIPFNVAAAMLLGENIGTTATAEISALVGNVYAKRSARIHTLFNVIGVMWMVFALPWVLDIIAGFMPADPYDSSEMGRQAATTALAAFHSVFNLATLLILIWFVPALVKLATKTVRSKGGEDEEFRLEYIDTSIQLSEISLLEARKQIVRFGEITSRMSGFVKNLLTETEQANQKTILKRIKKYEKITDQLEIEISQYCSKLSATELSAASSERVRSFLSIGSDLERIGDIFYQMANTIERKTASRIWFAPDQREKLLRMFGLVEMAMDLMLENLDQDDPKRVNLEKAQSLEKEINELRNKLRREYISRIESGNYNLRSGTVYSDLFSSLEKVGDHIENVSEALTGKI